ncbi:glutaredoxin 3 [Pseudoluteimonas lycopersici]|uniref:Glutaredoxin n=1 Tax=Pseudoluteimonas lycopersici TaxID=1324796 RepID=A0A516V218_9GAMM|nr:glutaredoxin 3 [Lysobacter lycopersici]
MRVRSCWQDAAFGWRRCEWGLSGWKIASPARIFDCNPPYLFPETALSDAPAITIYTTAICPYCVAAKNFLKSKGRDWTEVRVDTDPAEREKMIARTRRTSVPQIFIGDTHVGGYDDMMALHRAGKLEALLEGAGA